MSEKWVPVLGYEGLYSVSNLGRVRGEEKIRDRGRGVLAKVKARILKPYTKNVYDSVSLVKGGVKKTRNIHSIVAESFLGKLKKGFCVLHNDGNSKNNSLANLRIGTQTENMKDREVHGNTLKGEKHHRSILNEDQVNYVLSMKGKKTCRELGLELGVSFSTISKINTGTNWKCLKK